MPDYHDDLLPPKPDLIPAELRKLAIDNTHQWEKRVPPQAVGMFIAAVTQWLSHPRMGTKVTVNTLDNGWTITVELPTPDPTEHATIPSD